MTLKQKQELRIIALRLVLKTAEKDMDGELKASQGFIPFMIEVEGASSIAWMSESHAVNTGGEAYLKSLWEKSFASLSNLND